MKRFVAMVSAVALICSLMAFAYLPITASAATAYSGVCGEKVMWFLEDGTLTVMGIGPMTNFDPEIGGPLFSWRESITSVVIEDGVTSVGGNAFSNCNRLTSVHIPDSITSIAYQAFMACSSLTSITIPASVTSIGLFAFDWCDSLHTVFYTGSEAQKSSIAIDQGSDNLKNAKWHYDVTRVLLTDGYVYDCSCCDSYYYPDGTAATDVYTVTFQYEDGTVISKRAYTSGETVALPPTPAPQKKDHTFAGWDKEVTVCQGNAVYTAVFTQQAVPVVAKVGDVSYPTLQEALDAAQKLYDGGENVVVDLIGDLKTDDIAVIPKGVTLDIAANTLQVKALIGVEGAMLNAGTPNAKGDGMGKLVIPRENLILAEEAFVNADGRTVLPIWNGDHYEFGQFQVRVTETDSQGLFVDEENKTIKFVFRHVNSGWYVNNVLNNNNAGESGIQVVLELSWKVKDANGEIIGTPFQNFVYTEKLFQEILDGGDNYTFTLTGYDAMYLDPAQMQIVAKVVSDTGACAVLDPIDISFDKLT